MPTDFDRDLSALLGPAAPAVSRKLDSDGYTEGQRDRALVLDMFAEWDRAGTCASALDHPATKLSDDDVNAACDALVADDMLVPEWMTQRDGLPNLTSKGQAAHAAAQRVLADIAAAIPA